MSGIVWLTEDMKEGLSAESPVILGLVDMAVLKLPVAPGFIMAPESYREFINSTGLTKRLTQLLDSLSSVDGEEVERASSEIMRLFSATEFCDRQLSEISENYSLIKPSGKTLAKGPGNSDPYVIVRAGDQVREGLGPVRGLGRLSNAIRRCWASAFLSSKFRLGAYDMPPIVIQRLVDVDRSGIMSFDEDGVKISACKGFFDSENADSYAISYPQLEIVSRQIAEKRLLTGFDHAKGEFVERESQADAAEPATQVFTDKELLELAKFMGHVNKNLGKRVIEFGIEDNNIYLLNCLGAGSFNELLEARRRADAAIGGVGGAIICDDATADYASRTLPVVDGTEGSLPEAEMLSLNQGEGGESQNGEPEDTGDTPSMGREAVVKAVSSLAEKYSRINPSLKDVFDVFINDLLREL
ncbi:hypothetical protein COT48_05405 [Candidatus Woesearchaeota archaeon CG08_land_8_20_14_0_20_47_9]|nr:MAG: hypothetical protein AUJ69_01970 [Candidatus Woesearchaeota archaeon CG1_02_47_18]PIO03336.1 MAG: hypothetical protein COT48_05405 [Candidatus Woesearchaeota archaeon CG08_land_8_20_14_0_20_47_9]HII29996.1 hypothetical protein [Candidatus Woesearchaeota archaeon]